MIKLYNKSSIPDLRKKVGYMEQYNLKNINLTPCIVIMLIMMVLIISIYIVAAGGNSNYPLN
jgi:biopolymer transport protein ExbD